jgi:hypothetical protein
MKRLLVLMPLVATMLVATTSAQAGHGAELVTILCAAEYTPSESSPPGHVYIALFAPDTPSMVPLSLPGAPDSFDVGAFGEGVFAPGGQMSITCADHPAIFLPRSSPFFSGDGSCTLLRGGTPFGEGANVYAGRAHVLVVPASGRVMISCTGGFIGILQHAQVVPSSGSTGGSAGDQPTPPASASPPTANRHHGSIG